MLATEENTKAPNTALINFTRFKDTDGKVKISAVGSTGAVEPNAEVKIEIRCIEREALGVAEDKQAITANEDGSFAMTITLQHYTDWDRAYMFIITAQAPGKGLSDYVIATKWFGDL